MDIESTVMLIVSAFLLIYLGYAMMRPEKF